MIPELIFNLTTSSGTAANENARQPDRVLPSQTDSWTSNELPFMPTSSGGDGQPASPSQSPEDADDLKAARDALADPNPGMDFDEFRSKLP